MVSINDDMIVELFFRREESAIEQCQQKFGALLNRIAENILKSPEDSSECVNDTYLKAWNSIPPDRPVKLSCYLGRITRQLSIDRYRRKNSQKRAASQYALSLEELEDCISAGDATQSALELRQLGAAINEWLDTLSRQERGVFLCRYYFADSIADIAGFLGCGEGRVKSMLLRSRGKLRKHLEKEGYSL